MPGINFAELRARIPIREVLELLHYHPYRRRGDQLRGPCPVHQSRSPRSRSFSVNLSKNTYQCFKCGSAGNQLDLWAAATNQSIYQAAVSLCERLNLEPPWMKR